MIICVMLGPPGSGKGTQSSILSSKIGLPTVSTGQMLRDIMSTDNAIGAGSSLVSEIKAIVERGDLIPDELMSRVLFEKLKDSKFSNGVILDGYPRNVSQAQTLDNALKSLNCNKFCVLYFDLSDAEVVERLSGRYSCISCKTQYHKLFKKPRVEGVCDVCGSTEFQQRSDDSSDAIKHRLNVYHDQTHELLGYYKESDKVLKIDASLNIEDITKQILLKLPFQFDSNDDRDQVNN